MKRKGKTRKDFPKTGKPLTGKPIAGNLGHPPHIAGFYIVYPYGHHFKPKVLIMKLSTLFCIFLLFLSTSCKDSKKKKNPADPCNPNPCTESFRTRCEVQGSQALCFCDSGYVEQGEQCVPADSCDPNPCTEPNRTQCTLVGGAVQCNCDPGTVLVNNTCEPVSLPSCESCDLECPQNSRCDFVAGQGATCVCNPGYQDHDKNGTCEPGCPLANPTCGSTQYCSDRSGTATCVEYVKPPIYIAFHWHMHQPIYWPYESIVQTEQLRQGDMGYSVYEIHNHRHGPYTDWPKNAVGAGLSLPHLGAQVSLSGSLIENLNNMEAAGAGFYGWKNPWMESRTWRTTLDNPRLDIVLFGYHHPLMGLIDERDIRLQIQTHRRLIGQVFGQMDSRGIFPPECAFTPRMIPALVAEGIEWTMVDNIHFDRAHRDYPWVPQSNLLPPNRADQLNDAPTGWLQLNDIWAPSKVASPWGYQPHWVEYRNPETCEVSRIIAVPAARYEGNEDARGGFGALQYDAVLSQHEPYNTNPDRPMLIVLHHDGDNYGGGTDSYYHSNFHAFVSWVQANPDRFVATTIQDYLDMFPPADYDLIHVEDGSWSGADNGDPEFAKWNGKPVNGYSPDRNSWAVITAAKNRVLTAEAIEAPGSIDDIMYGTGNDTARAWHFLLNGETSCYWYWDGEAAWDSHPTRASNQAVSHADAVIARGQDTVPPTIYAPQRIPYNPGMDGEPSDFQVWTLVYDVSGLSRVTLFYRVDDDGVRDWANDLYAGGSWQVVTMTGRSVPSQLALTPTYMADLHEATITGVRNRLVDYFVEAEDTLGHIARSPIRHVWVGDTGGPGGDLFVPAEPTSSDVITVYWHEPGFLHWGINGWQLPPEHYWPTGTVPFGDGQAVQTPLSGPDGDGRYSVQIGPFNQTPVTQVDFVFFIPPDSWPLSPDGVIPVSN